MFFITLLNYRMGKVRLDNASVLIAIADNVDTHAVFGFGYGFHSHLH